MPYGAVRAGDFKLIEFFDDSHVELYNLRDDPGEQHDLAGPDAREGEGTARTPPRLAGGSRGPDADAEPEL